VKPEYRQCMMAVIRNPAWVSFTWLGMTAGVSLLATPFRFAAETITRPVALDVGRVVFAALNKAEFVALVIVLVILRMSAHARELWIPVFALALILILQAGWLLPELAARTDLIIAGIEPEPSIAHAAYSVLELLKLLLLAFVGFRSLQLLRS
jgi:hypothetical protein